MENQEITARIHKGRLIDSYTVLKAIQEAYPKEEELQGFSFAPDFVNLKKEGEAEKPFCFIKELSDKYIIYDSIKNELYIEHNKKSIKTKKPDTRTFYPKPTIEEHEAGKFKPIPKSWSFLDDRTVIVRDNFLCQDNFEAHEKFKKHFKKPAKFTEFAFPVTIDGAPCWAVRHTKNLLYINIENNNKIHKMPLGYNRTLPKGVNQVLPNQKISHEGRNFTFLEEIRYSERLQKHYTIRGYVEDHGDLKPTKLKEKQPFQRAIFTKEHFKR